jgi:ectoine hydroxylase-related dioxygenase (phytanoyl-CoA dioxygenase family)
MLQNLKSVMITNIDLNFYKENGYLIIRNFLTKDKISKLNKRYKELRRKLAKQSKIKQEDYDKEISQIRDIWRLEEDYNRLILKEEISLTAPLFFLDQSCRLLHDHIINKPINNNGIVPWHQDYTYWPTDNPNGLSFWLPFSDLDANAGVLQVVPKSHLWGEDKPIDFMNDEKDFSNHNIQYLTVNKGDLVILDALTWHRSSNNISVKERIAYITLWISTSSRYAPKHASWHPVNDNVEVNEGEVLNDNWFPVIGTKKIMNQKTPYRYNDSTEDMSKITMFNASKITRNFLQKHLEKEENIWQYLYDENNLKDAVHKLTDLFKLSKNNEKELQEILHSMSINGMAYQNHRARNVYNKSYVKFKKIFKI